ncbi:hypothetical protein [Moraxella bovis]|nr:hypothetical protein [Moraxella bovis]
MSACAYANSHPNADELIGCLKHDEDKPYQSMMCLLLNQRVMISAVGMVAFGGYQLVDDVMSIEMDKPSVFAVMSRHNRYQDGTRLHIKGEVMKMVFYYKLMMMSQITSLAVVLICVMVMMSLL